MGGLEEDGEDEHGPGLRHHDGGRGDQAAAEATAGEQAKHDERIPAGTLFSPFPHGEGHERDGRDGHGECGGRHRPRRRPDGHTRDRQTGPAVGEPAVVGALGECEDDEEQSGGEEDGAAEVDSGPPNGCRNVGSWTLNAVQGPARGRWLVAARGPRAVLAAEAA
jgi:hypothetical protein